MTPSTNTPLATFASASPAVLAPIPTPNHPIRPASDNDDDRSFASDARVVCEACRRRFRPNGQAKLFCDRDCYFDWLRRRPIGQRFWAKVRKTATCWLWTGAKTGGGGVRHGQVMCRGLYRTPQKAHRIAWELTHGPIAGDLQVNHHCDVPLCCNPEHLYLGTQRDNMRDASVRGRLTVARTRKLSQAQRLTIYQTPSYRGIGADLAQRYGVSAVCIHFIRQGRFLGSGVWHGTTVRDWRVSVLFPVVRRA